MAGVLVDETAKILRKSVQKSVLKPIPSPPFFPAHQSKRIVVMMSDVIIVMSETQRGGGGRGAK